MLLCFRLVEGNCTQQAIKFYYFSTQQDPVEEKLIVDRPNGFTAMDLAHSHSEKPAAAAARSIWRLPSILSSPYTLASGTSVLEHY